MHNKEYKNLIQNPIFNIKIHIYHPHKSFREMRRELDKNITNLSNNQYADYLQFNNTYNFLNWSLARKMSYSGQYRAYIVNYIEQEGSLIISFSIIVIGLINNYGSLRSAIDYFLSDIEGDISHILIGQDPNYRINSIIDEKWINSSSQELGATNRGITTITNQTSTKLLIIISIALLFAILSSFYSYEAANKKNDLNAGDIRKIIQEELRNQRIDEHIYFQKQNGNETISLSKETKNIGK
ncbi:hypothetical protein [Sphingobacterium sp.]|uniref:hypothetical protein n=1 Tax=Sphingobacterium sp. TaxID=341027 RepID=UPI0028B09B43|nr:hypothetical protein [Sphingobacterium sp.]